ncbi:MAG: hypothetical protein AAGA48_34040 [Myxococcota bacterium]
MRWLRAVALMTVAAVSSSASSAFSDGGDAAPVPLLADIEAPPPPVEPEPPPRPADPYLAERYDLEILRQSLADQRAQGVPVDEAARLVLSTSLPALMEHWVGTRYSYSGTSQVPKQGKIACGYYVSTVLEHAGFDLDRVDVARQASEQIIRTLVPDRDIVRFSRARRKKVVAHVQDQGEGLYVVGLDTHVGFLVNDGLDVTFCHSTRRKRKGVVCEEAVSSPSLKSRYTVLGRLDNPVAIAHWLDQDRFVTARKGFRQPPSFGTLPEAGPSGGPRATPARYAVALLP